MIRSEGQNVWIWGDPAWGFLNADAAASDAVDAVDTVVGTTGAVELTFEDTVRALNDVVPCMFCEDSMRLFVPQIEAEKRSSLGDMVRSKRCIEFVHALHNKVNQKLWAQHISNSLHPLLDAISKRMGCDKDECSSYASSFISDMHLFQPRSISLELFRRRIKANISGQLHASQLGLILVAVARAVPKQADAAFYTQHCKKLNSFFLALCSSARRIALLHPAPFLPAAIKAIMGSLVPFVQQFTRASGLYISGGSVELVQQPLFSKKAFQLLTAKTYLAFAPWPPALSGERTAEALVQHFDQLLSVKKCAVDTCA